MDRRREQKTCSHWWQHVVPQSTEPLQKLQLGILSFCWWVHAKLPSLTWCLLCLWLPRTRKVQLISTGNFILSIWLLKFYSSVVSLWWAFMGNTNIFTLCVHSEKSSTYLSSRPPYYQCSQCFPFRCLTTLSVNPFYGYLCLRKLHSRAHSLTLCLVFFGVTMRRRVIPQSATFK